MIQKVEPYSQFSHIYTRVMEHVNFSKWANFIKDSIYPYEPLSVLDLGCGTGDILREFSYSQKRVGIDRSKEMLAEAKKSDPKGEYLVGNLAKLRISGKFDLVLCTHDTVNYLLEERDLYSFFREVAGCLKPSSHFFFDISSEFNLAENFHRKVIREEIGETFLEWTNEYLPETKRILSYLHFTRYTDKGPKYFEEVHEQRYYSLEEIRNALAENGMKILRIGSDYEKWKEHKKASLVNILASPI